jgi:hypothetical protein
MGKSKLIIECKFIKMILDVKEVKNESGSLDPKKLAGCKNVYWHN